MITLENLRNYIDSRDCVETDTVDGKTYLYAHLDENDTLAEMTNSSMSFQVELQGDYADENGWIDEYFNFNDSADYLQAINELLEEINDYLS